MRVLVVNAGSSSLKLSLVGNDEELIADHEQPVLEGDDASAQLVRFVSQLDGVDAVGHRVVHGGADFREATRIDDGVEYRVGGLASLAPLHQARALAGIRAVRSLLPDVPAFACFDTAFHTTLAPAAATFALPAEWREQWGLRRFGFHGLSHAYAARRAGELLGRPITDLRTVTCHLGAGASLCAVAGGQSVDTTMGFTPLEGLVMATRSGSVDPGLLLWVLQQNRASIAEVGHVLEERSGLAGLSGTSGDMREVLAAADTGDERAVLALGVYIHRLRREIAAMAAATGGIDVLVFTAGVGEHAPEVRARAAAGLGFLGVQLDAQRNQTAQADTDISAEQAVVRTLVLEAREDLEIARQVRAASYS